ncbi:hypothetical protein HUU05_08505 [candidate division KSB1 bacterium]|nr:hypothetical protein [candidate division KSB1 bacterium]
MIVTDKPNPFQVLGLPAHAANQEIVERGQELCELAESDAQRLLYRWAMEQLITKSLTRLEYELFEIPDAQYEDEEWERFIRLHRNNPIDIAALAAENPPPGCEDFDLQALVMLYLTAMLKAPKGDLKTAVEHSPFKPGVGLSPLEVRDVIFG